MRSCREASDAALVKVLAALPSMARRDEVCVGPSYSLSELAEAQAASTVVKAGSSTTITVTATPPANAPAGHTDIDVSATAGTKTIPGKLGIDITGTFKLTLSTPGDLLSAHGSAGSAMRQTLEVRNGGTGDLEPVAAVMPYTVQWMKAPSSASGSSLSSPSASALPSILEALRRQEESGLVGDAQLG